jgi:Fic family protein
MKAHNVGLEKIKNEAMDRERSLTESFIRELNKTILVENYWETSRTEESLPPRIEMRVGEYKSRPNSVITSTGEEFKYAAPEETSAMMTTLVAWCNEAMADSELTPIEIATLFHYRFIRIHPFQDGNGRIARLIVNFILYRFGYPMVIIHSEDKENYFSALRQSDVEVGFSPSDGANASLAQIQPFLKYMTTQLERSLELSIKAAKGESIEDDSDFRKQLTLLKQKAQKEKKLPALDTPQNKLNVYNLFHRYFAMELKVALIPVRGGLKMKNISIHHEASAIFERGYYVFNGKTFIYGTYPSEEETKLVIDTIKKEVLLKIQNAIHED